MSDLDAVVVVLDIGGTTTRVARMRGSRIERTLLCDTPTLLLFPERPLELLQAELVALATDLTISITHELSEAERTNLRVAVSISGQVSSDLREVLSAPDVWGSGDLAYPLATALEAKLTARADGPSNCDVRVCNDAIAAAAAWSKSQSRSRGDESKFALLMVRTGLSYVVSDAATSTGPVLLGHLTMPGATDGFECTCGDVDHFTSYVTGTGINNMLIRAALHNPKSFRSSELFRLASQKYETSRFEDRLASFGRHAVVCNTASFIDPDVWRSMHDRHAEITPGEKQRWVLPALLDAAMFIEAVSNKDAYALELLDAIATPVATYLERYVFDDVDVIALSGGFARALGEPYRSRIAPNRPTQDAQWADSDDLADFRNAQSFLWPSKSDEVIDLRDVIRA